MTSTLDPDNRAEAPRYVVGIDLGTTNSAVCYVDTVAGEDWHVDVFRVPQIVAPGEVESRETLPSFHYQPGSEEFSATDLCLPWEETPAPWLVGVFARDHGVQVPSRLIASAKSWLCHGGVDRTAAILPWQGGEDVERLSPVDVSSRLLRQIVAAWDHRFPDAPLADQTVVLTIPASFDEVARNLTIQAAQKAGLRKVLLIEEPQAAFYAWINRHQHDWTEQVHPGQKILVCDVGGGTTDFTLIRVRESSSGDVLFHRVAVGEHLILGGDNLDLSVAKFIEQKLQQQGIKELTPRQWSVLVRVARTVKETLLGADAPEDLTVTLPGSGSRLIGGSLQVSVTRAEVTELLTEGFLPRSAFTDMPQTTQSGFREFGLPYAPDSAITRYLAHFLRIHAETAADNVMLKDDVQAARPDIILFNGGLFESQILKERLTEIVASWFPADGGNWQPRVLDCERLDLAVAHGAACFGMVSRGSGTRISAGLPRTYYLGVENEGQSSAVCLVPAGTEPGTKLDPPDQKFRLYTGRPVEFPVYFSATRLTDAPGVVIPLDEEQLTALPPIRTVIKTRGDDRQSEDEPAVCIQIHAGLTEIGTLDLWCSAVDTNERWKLQFDVRSAVRTDIANNGVATETDGVVDERMLENVESMICDVFLPESDQKPGGLARRIAREISISRNDWPTSLLREMWQMLIDVQDGRRKSAAHEATWLNLLGFSLRPGFGYVIDDWRVDTTWETLRGKLIHSTPQVRNQWWVLWRRIAGGLSGGRQTELASQLLSSIRQTAQQLRTGRGKSGPVSLHDQDAAEVWRVLGAFEGLAPAVRHELGDIILNLLPRPKMKPVRDAMIWTLGRLGARRPLSGKAQAVLSPDTVADWTLKLMTLQVDDLTATPLAIAQMARRTHDRMIDLPAAVRDEAVRYLREMNGPESLIQLIAEGGETDRETLGQMLGDSLPLGLRIS